jgi:hypothetical protein
VSSWMASAGGQGRSAARCRGYSRLRDVTETEICGLCAGLINEGWCRPRKPHFCQGGGERC